MKKKKRINEKRLIIKFLVCSLYLVIMTILFVCAYKQYQDNTNIVSWTDVKSIEDYSYINVYKMSEKFAYYKETNTGIHFVIEKEPTGQWHTYLIAINEDDYDKYKEIIDYSYERIEERPDSIKVYGYPTIISDELKQLAIKNIANFIPSENEVTITEENYETYLTNSYLDTTKEQKEDFNLLLFLTLFSILIVLFLFIATLLDKDKIVDNLEDAFEEEINKTKNVIKSKKKKRKK